MKILFSGAIHDNSGYAIHARDLMKEIEAQGGEVSIDYRKPADKHIQVGLPTTYTDWKAPVKIAFCQWEATRLPKDWVDLLNKADLIIPGSQFVKDAMIASGVTTQIEVIRWPLNIDAWGSPLYPKPSIYPDSAYNVLAVGAFIPRKNFDDLIYAYTYAFQSIMIDSNGESRSEFPTMLTIKTNNCKDYLKAVVSSMSVDRKPLISIVTPNFKDMRNFYKYANLLVSCSHGEAVGGPILEAQAQGTPAMCTDWGGSPSYLVDGYKIKTLGLEPVNNMRHVCNYDNAEYARLDMGSFIEQLQRAYIVNRRVVFNRPKYEEIAKWIL